MRFANIDGQEAGMLFVVVEDLDDVADLATEWRSGETSEDYDERFCASAFAYVKRFRAIQRENARIGSGVTNF